MTCIVCPWPCFIQRYLLQLTCISNIAYLSYFRIWFGWLGRIDCLTSSQRFLARSPHENGGGRVGQLWQHGLRWGVLFQISRITGHGHRSDRWYWWRHTFWWRHSWLRRNRKTELEYRKRRHREEEKFFFVEKRFPTNEFSVIFVTNLFCVYYYNYTICQCKKQVASAP